jgi:hypothetical protein
MKRMVVSSHPFQMAEGTIFHLSLDIFHLPFRLFESVWLLVASMVS